jgi:hypothetical protein
MSRNQHPAKYSEAPYAEKPFFIKIFDHQKAIGKSLGQEL